MLNFENNCPVKETDSLPNSKGGSMKETDSLPNSKGGSGLRDPCSHFTDEETQAPEREGLVLSLSEKRPESKVLVIQQDLPLICIDFCSVKHSASDVAAESPDFLRPAFKPITHHGADIDLLFHFVVLGKSHFDLCHSRDISQGGTAPRTWPVRQLCWGAAFTGDTRLACLSCSPEKPALPDMLTCYHPDRKDPAVKPRMTETCRWEPDCRTFPQEEPPVLRIWLLSATYLRVV